MSGNDAGAAPTHWAASPPLAPSQPNPFGTASLTLASVSWLFVAGLELFPRWLIAGGSLFASAAVVCGIVGLKRASRYPLRRDRAIIGIALGGVGALVFITYTLFLAFVSSILSGVHF